MTKRYLTCAETAKLVRAALKSAHPGIKFSVRSDSYAGGASMRVRWTDGPTVDVVEQTARLYEGASFDGMIDLKSYHDSLLAAPDGSLEAVHFGADFIFTDRDVSDAFVTSLLPRVQQSGRDDHAGQCDNCGNWMQPGARWYARVEEHRSGFCCSQECGARYLARRTDAASVSA